MAELYTLWAVLGFSVSSFSLGLAAGLMIACRRRKARQHAPRRFAQADGLLLGRGGSEFFPLHDVRNA